MLVQRCALDQNRLVLPVSITKPQLSPDGFVQNFSLQRYNALVDTGAQRTVVGRSLIAEHSLLRTGHMQFGGLHGTQTHSRYLASLGLWAKRIDRDSSSVDFEAAELSLFSIEVSYEVVDMENNTNFDIILGFDVLKLFEFGFDPRERIFEIVIKP